MNNTVFRKNYGKFEKTWRCQAYNNQSKNELLVSEPNYHTTKIFSKYFLAIEKKILWILMIKPVYLGLTIVESEVTAIGLEPRTT